MSRRGLAAAALLAVLAPAGAARAAHICWIDRVERVSGGLNIYFIDRAELRVNVSRGLDQAGFYFVSGGVAHQRRPDRVSRETADHIFVRDGDRLYLSQMIEDNCTIDVTANDQEAGLHAEAVIRLYGMPPSKATEFIGATASTAAKE